MLYAAVENGISARNVSGYWWFLKSENDEEYVGWGSPVDDSLLLEDDGVFSLTLVQWETPSKSTQHSVITLSNAFKTNIHKYSNQQYSLVELTYIFRPCNHLK